jgi:hypothetical protein
MLTAWPSRDLVVAAHQQITRDWWEHQRSRFELVVSQLVLDEAARGDPEAARERLQALDQIALLETTEGALKLAQDMVAAAVFPDKAAPDALHVALAAVHGVDILLTWNCRHLANGEILAVVQRHLWTASYTPPVVCTPEELMGE